MKKYIYETISEHKVQQKLLEWCDFCKKEIKSKSHTNNFSEVTLEFRKGYTYRDSGYGKVENFDCCENCWKEIKKHFLYHYEINPEETEYYW